MKKEEEHDPMKWTKEAQAELDAAVASTPAGHPDAARLKGGSLTPRTDAFTFTSPYVAVQGEAHSYELVDACVARTFEEELTTALEQLNSANAQIAELKDKLKRCAEAGLDVAADQIIKLREADAQIVTLRGALEKVTTIAYKEAAKQQDIYNAHIGVHGLPFIHNEVREAVNDYVQQALSSPAPAVVPSPQLTEMQADAEALADALVVVSAHDGPGFPHGTCASIAGEALAAFRAKHPAKGGADE